MKLNDRFGNGNYAKPNVSLEHVIDRSLGGTNKLVNCVLAHKQCNAARNNYINVLDKIRKSTHPRAAFLRSCFYAILEALGHEEATRPGELRRGEQYNAEGRLCEVVPDAELRAAVRSHPGSVGNRQASEPAVLVMKYVHGIFQHSSGKRDGTEYTFITDIECKRGDFAVVETVNGFSVIEITSLEQKNRSNYAVKELKAVVDIVDMTKHNAKKDAKDRLELLEATLQQRVSELMEAKKFEMLEQDPQSVELIKEFKALKGL